MSTTENETTQAPERIIAAHDTITLGVAGDQVEIKDSLIGAAAAGNMTVHDSLILVAAAGSIEGEAQVLMEASTALLFGAALGTVLAIVGRLLRRR